MRHDLGVAYVPDDRHEEGLLLDAAIWENLYLGRDEGTVLVPRARLRDEARRAIAELDVRPADAEARVRALSGGNQQKVLLARELGRAPSVLVCAQPTRGVDIGAIAEIHARLLALAESGTAILLFSAELDEIFALADRVQVLYRGAYGCGARARRRRHARAARACRGCDGRGCRRRQRERSGRPRTVDRDRAPRRDARHERAHPRVGTVPAQIYALLLVDTWGNAYGLGQVLYKATPLLLTGLAVSFALRAGLFNVGAEGQITIGGFAAALVGGALPAGTSALVAAPLCLLAAAAGGALVGFIPGWLKARRGAHEVIVTIMLNFVVRAAMVGAGTALFMRESVHTRPVAPGATLAKLSHLFPALRGSSVSLAFPLAIAVVCGVAWLLARTRLGFRIGAVGAQPKVAATAGIDVGRTTIAAFVFAGAIAGLGGASFVLGNKGYYEAGFAGGVGFVGIAVAVLGGTRPLGLLLAALLFGTLAQGAFAVNAICPKEIIDVMQAVIIIGAAAAAARATPGRGA